MKAMVLAAGKGTRLLPLTEEVPKPMAPVAGKPIIRHIFELLASSGVEEIHVNVCHLADVVLEHFRMETMIDGARVSFSREEELMGTAGGVRRLADRFDDTFVVVMGDALTDVDVREVVAFHKARGAIATLGLMRVTDTSRYGVVDLGPGGEVRGFQEKPDPREALSDLANTGIYVLEPAALDYIPENEFFDFAQDVFPRLLEAGERFVGYEGDFYWSDVGTIEAYQAAQRDALSGRVRLKIPGERLRDGLWVDRDAWLHPTVKLEGGKVVIGPDAVVGPGVTLVDDVTVGSGCWIRPGATVKGSVLLPGATVGDGSYLEGCVVGPGYDLSPGAKVHDRTLVRDERTENLVYRNHTLSEPKQTV